MKKELIEKINSFIPIYRNFFDAIEFLNEKGKLTAIEYIFLKLGCRCKTEDIVLKKLMYFRKELIIND